MTEKFFISPLQVFLGMVLLVSFWTPLANGQEEGAPSATAKPHRRSFDIIDDLLQTRATQPDDGATASSNKGTIRNPFISKIPREKTPDRTVTTPTNTESTVAPKKEPERPKINISGLVWNTDRPQAILDGKVVNIGDSVQGWKVTKINKKGVEISLEGTTFTIEP